MSAKGIFWLSRLAAGEIKNGAFRVLFHLAQSHSDDKDPRVACYPTQANLISRTGLSNGSLNNALNDLEEAGFIRRRRTTIAGGKKQRTFYILGCDFPMLGDLPEEIDEDGNIDGITNSTRLEFDRNKLQKSAEQTPKKAPNKLQPAGEYNINNNINRSSSAEAEQKDEKKNRFSGGFFSDLLQAAGVSERGWWAGDKARAHVQAWLDSGLTEEQIVEAARKHREKMPEAPNGPKALDAAMGRLKAAPQASAPVQPEAILAFWAEKLRGSAYVAPSSLSISLANELLRRGLVVIDDLRRRGIAFTFAPSSRPSAA